MNMWRKLFKRLSILSFVLCLATVGWWYRTNRKVDQLTYERPAVESLRVSGYGGKVVVRRAVQDSSQSWLGPAQLAWNSTASAQELPAASKSFSYTKQASTGGGRESMLILPLWLITAAFALMPLCWVGTRFRKKKKAEQKAKE